MRRRREVRRLSRDRAAVIPFLQSVASGQDGHISAAVLDVFRDEPLPAGHPFWHHPRIVVTPHVAAATHPPTAAPIILDNIRRFEAGRPLLNRVDPAQGY